MGLSNDSPVRLGVSPYAQRFIQNRALHLMTSTCVIYTPNVSDATYDPVTGTAGAAAPAYRYEGPCRLWEVPGGQSVVVGDQEVTITQTYFALPFWVTPLPERGDTIEILTSDDADLVGRTVSIKSTIRGGGLRASRRFLVEVADSPKSSW